MEKRVTNLKIKEEYPPNYLEIQSVLGNVAQHKPIFCYGNTIYNPFKRTITPDIEIHEEVHSKQQGEYPDVWYYQYLHNREFRTKQEIEAYGTQYAFAKKLGVRGEMLEWLLTNMAEALSGSIYDTGLSLGEAEAKIRLLAKQKDV